MLLIVGFGDDATGDSLGEGKTSIAERSWVSPAASSLSPKKLVHFTLTLLEVSCKEFLLCIALLALFDETNTKSRAHNPTASAIKRFRTLPSTLYPARRAIV